MDKAPSATRQRGFFMGSILSTLHPAPGRAAYADTTKPARLFGHGRFHLAGVGRIPALPIRAPSNPPVDPAL